MSKRVRRRFADSSGKEQKIKAIQEKLGFTNARNVNYRLMQEYEVPDWVRVRPQEQDVAMEECGVGKRSRKTVNYNDELTETQWAKIIDQGGDLNEEIERAREKRLGKKRPNGTCLLYTSPSPRDS